MKTLRNSTQKARKQHSCNYCFQPIDKGTIYNKQVNVYEGNMYEWKSHPDCDAIASILSMHHEAEEGLTGDDFVEFIKEEYQQIMIKLELNDLPIPNYVDQLYYVCNHHSVKIEKYHKQYEKLKI